MNMENYNYFCQQFAQIQEGMCYGDPNSSVNLTELVEEMLETIKRLEEKLDMLTKDL